MAKKDTNDSGKNGEVSRDFSKVTVCVEPDELTREFIKELEAGSIRKSVEKSMALLRCFPNFIG